MIQRIQLVIRTYWLELLLGCFAFALMSINMDYVEIDPYAEFFNLQAAKETWLSGQVLPLKLNQQNYWSRSPLWTWITMFLFHWTGIGLTATRLLATACTALTMVLSGTLAARLFKAKQAGLYTIVVLACSFACHYWGTLSTADALTSLLYLSFLHLLLNCLDQPGRRQGNTFFLRMNTSFMGILLGLVTLTKDPLSAVFLSSLGGSLVYINKKQSRTLPSLPIRFIVFGLLGVLALWFIPASIFSGNTALPVAFLFQYPVQRFLGAGPWSQLEHHWFFYAGQLVWDALLLLAFIPASFIERFSHNRREGEQETLQKKWLIGWFLAGFLLYSSSAFQEPSTVLTLLPPLAILTGYYFSKVAETKGKVTLNTFQNTLIIVILLILFSTILLTVVLFHVTPNNFPQDFWAFPGIAMLESIYGFPLPEAFPLWKLWLIPGPFILLTGCFALSLIQSEKQFVLLPSILLTTFITLGLYSRWVYLPMFSRPAAQKLASQVSTQINQFASDTESKVILHGHTPNIKRILFFLNKKASQSAQLTHSQDSLKQSINTENHYVFGIISNQQYYHMLDEADRQNLQLIDYRWNWEMANLSELGKILVLKNPQFSSMQSGAILFSRLPETLAEETTEQSP